MDTEDEICTCPSCMILAGLHDAKDRGVDIVDATVMVKDLLVSVYAETTVH